MDTREHEARAKIVKGAGSAISVRKRQQRANLDLQTGLFPQTCAVTQQGGLFYYHLQREHTLENQGASGKNKKEQGAKKNEKGAEIK